MPSAESMLDAYETHLRRVQTQGVKTTPEECRAGIAWLALLDLVNNDRKGSGVNDQREALARLNDHQVTELGAVAEHYLAHTRFAEAEDCSLLPASRDAILRRRAVCHLVTGSARP